MLFQCGDIFVPHGHFCTARLFSNLAFYAAAIRTADFRPPFVIHVSPIGLASLIHPLVTLHHPSPYGLKKFGQT